MRVWQLILVEVCGIFSVLGASGRPIFIQCWYWELLCSSYEVAKPQPSTGVLDKNPASMGPNMLSSTGAGVWRKAPGGFPDSNSGLDQFCDRGTFSQILSHEQAAVLQNKKLSGRLRECPLSTPQNDLENAIKRCLLCKTGGQWQTAHLLFLMCPISMSCIFIVSNLEGCFHRTMLS